MFIELGVVSYIDLKSRKISNFWPLLNLALFFLCLTLFPDQYVMSWTTFFFPLVFLMVGFILYLLKIMGPGDSKFLFSLYLLTPVHLHEATFLCLAYSTVFVGGTLLAVNTIRNFDRIKTALIIRDVAAIKGVYGKKFPYAPVILFSWAWLGWEIKSKIFF
jgi:prepilin peptidase CpaA